MSSQHHLFKYLRQKKNRTNVDHLMLVASILSPLSAVPQIIQMYSTKDVEGLSLLSWLGWGLIGLVFLAYGIGHRLKSYILMQVLWTAVTVLMIVGIIIYS